MAPGIHYLEVLLCINRCVYALPRMVGGEPNRILKLMNVSEIREGAQNSFDDDFIAKHFARARMIFQLD